MEMKNIKISKLDAARRQLITAIRLYFNDGDIVSMHTLTAASFKITQNICDSSSDLPESWIESMDKFIKPEFKSKLIHKFHETANFFKHADRDPDAVHEFNPEQTQALLLMAVNQYQILTGEWSPEIRLLINWFMIQNPEIFYKTPEDVSVSLGQKLYGRDKNKFWREAMPLIQAEFDKSLI